MAVYRKWTSTVLVNGQPEPNVRIFVFSPGTTDQIPIYEDEGVTPITQPILTDSQGRYAFFVDVDAYPEIRLYLEKDGVDFSEVNEDLDGVAVPGAVGEVSMGFTDLTDTPSDYSGSGGQVVKVKTAEDGLEFGQVDHGELSGLSDDDHPQYLLADGSRPLSGDLDFQGHLAKVIGKLNFKDATILTISSGAITISQSYHFVDTEDEAASDDLDTINGGTAGDILYLRSADSSRTVVIKHGVGNIVTPDGTDYSLDSTDKVVALLCDGTNWHLVGAAGGGGSGASTFLGLTDTPSDYSGNAGKVVRVNAEENGLEFGTVSGGAGTFTELTDTPSSYVGRGGDVVVVKTTEDGIETQPWPVTGTVLNVFLGSDAADIGGYYYMYHTETGDTHSEFTSPSLSTGNDQLLWSFVTEAGQPGLNQLALGAYTATLFLKKTGNKDVRVYWKLFKRNTGGTETEILQSAVSDYLTADNSQYLISAYLNEDQVLDPTDRLVLKLYANVSGTGTDVTVTLTMEGHYDSRLTINVLSSAFNLDRLSDVTITSPADDELLAYDSGSGKWINQSASEAHLATATIADMEIYVNADTGDDSNGDGSASAPVRTLTRALELVPPVLRHEVTIKLVPATNTYSGTVKGFVCLPPSGRLRILGTSSPSDSGTVGSIDSEVADPEYGSVVYVAKIGDSSKSWTTNRWKHKILRLWKDGENEYYVVITYNNSTELYFQRRYCATKIDTTYSYEIYEPDAVLEDLVIENCWGDITLERLKIEDLVLKDSRTVTLLGCLISPNSGGGTDLFGSFISAAGTAWLSSLSGWHSLLRTSSGFCNASFAACLFEHTGSGGGAIRFVDSGPHGIRLNATRFLGNAAGAALEIHRTFLTAYTDPVGGHRDSTFIRNFATGISFRAGSQGKFVTDGTYLVFSSVTTKYSDSGNWDTHD